MNLPPGSVGSWGELCGQFVTKFSGSFTRPGMHGDLLAVRQRKGETLRQYIQRFSQVRNTIPRISPTAVIMAFRESPTSGWWVSSRPTTWRLSPSCSPWRTSTLGRLRRTPGSSAGVPPRNPWRVTTRIPVPRRTSERLPLSWPKQEKNDLQLGYVSS